jgi:hypothetical protein
MIIKLIFNKNENLMWRYVKIQYNRLDNEQIYVFKAKKSNVHINILINLFIGYFKTFWLIFTTSIINYK